MELLHALTEIGAPQLLAFIAWLLFYWHDQRTMRNDMNATQVTLATVATQLKDHIEGGRN